MAVKATWTDGESVNAAALNAVAVDLNAASAITTTLAERVEDIIGTKLVAGSNITISYDDSAGTTTIGATGGVGGTGGMDGGTPSSPGATTIDGGTV